MDRNRFKEMPFKEKVQHIWEYYKLAVFGIILGIIIIVSIIVGISRKKPEVILNVSMVNCNTFQVTEQDVFQRYLLENGYDMEAQTIVVKTNYKISEDISGTLALTSYQALNTSMALGEVDLLIGDDDVFQMFGSAKGFKSLSEVLTKEILEKYEDQLYTVIDTETKKEVVCGIRLQEDNPLVKDGYYEGSVLVGFPYSTTNQELAVEMLLYLLEN